MDTAGDDNGYCDYVHKSPDRSESPMNRVLSSVCWLVASAVPASVAFAAPGVDCEALEALALPDVVVNTATIVEEPAPHCKVTGTIGGVIGFSVWLPEDWNGRFLMGGSGGFVAPEDNQALRGDSDLLESGYATASTDTGHRAGTFDGSWALNDLEAIVNYGHLATHRATVTSKAIVAARYGQPATTSFFFGCSNGGRQGLQAAQRYPDDFDAIIAGAPALDFTGAVSSLLQIASRMHPDPTDLDIPVVSLQDRQRLRAAIEAQCDGSDGVEDGILQDPLACDFDPASLACSTDEAEACLDAEAVEAIRTVYQGPTAGAQALHVGFPFGAEATDINGWGSWLTGDSADGSPSWTASLGLGPSAAFAFGMGVMRYFAHHDPDWSYVGYDWNRYEDDTRLLAATLNADNPDLSAFRERGGKLLMYHGWSDVALSAHMSIDYLERVYELDPSAREDVRLFMMPGVLHCSGGPGPSQVDFVAALEAWHRSGEAPSELTASYSGQAR
jgi:pimeloyl-ACP methyl ester carboxylesterase